MILPSANSGPLDVLVIGGGIAGLSLSYHLRNSSLDLGLVEKSPILASHSSRKNAGMIRQLYRSPILRRWAADSVNTFYKHLPSDHFQMSGSLIIGRDLPEPEAGHYHNTHFSTKVVEINGASCPAVYTESDGVISPELVCRFLTDNSHFSRLHSDVARISSSDGLWTVETKSGQSIKAKTIVNCSGQWANAFLPSRLQVALKPYFRHLFTVDHWQPPGYQEGIGFIWNEIDNWYARKLSETSWILSICDLAPSHCDSVCQHLISNSVLRLAEEALESLGKNSQTKITAFWSCIRTYTEDKLPVFGEDPEAPGLYWMGAFGGYGMSTCFGAASMLAKLIQEDLEFGRKASLYTGELSQLSPCRLRQ